MLAWLRMPPPRDQSHLVINNSLLRFAPTIYLFKKLIYTHVYIYISFCQFWGPVLLPNTQTEVCITTATTERGHPGDDHLGSGRKQDMALETPRATS